MGTSGTRVLLVLDDSDFIPLPLVWPSSSQNPFPPQLCLIVDQSLRLDFFCLLLRVPDIERQVSSGSSLPLCLVVRCSTYSLHRIPWSRSSEGETGFAVS